MSRSHIVTKRKRMRWCAQEQPTGTSPRVHPMDPRNAMEVPYEGAPVLALPVAEEMTISNRSGERKKL